MISSEKRNVKPYALPVLCIPYVSITHEMMRSLINTLIKEMVGRNMSVAGEVCVLCVFMGIYHCLPFKDLCRMASITVSE